VTADRPSTLHLLVPGPLDQRTGGYLYDRRIVEGLRALGRDVRVHEVPGRFPDPDARAREGLAKALRSCPDGAVVVVDGLAGGALPGVLASQADRLRLVALVHHPLTDESGLDAETASRFRSLETSTLEAVEGVVVTSRHTARRLRDLGVDPLRVRVVEPGTEPAAPAVGPGPGAPPRLLTVGTVCPRKGHDVLVEALDRIRGLDWVCVCAGSLSRAPEFAGEVRRRVGEAGLESRMLFVGELDADELENAYASATVFVLASRFEGYGMALTEALARGLPVVSTTGGAIPGTVPEEAGVLVPPGDPDALALELARLLEDAAALRALADGARRVAASFPDWGSRGAAFEAALRELVGSPEPGGRG
jgi:glycosyltransferase involved in cell wall biosynthesis